jgi:uncharacterized protein
MAEKPVFPRFKDLDLEDREVITRVLDQYGPETSEWTFTNLFIWRSHYGFEWSIYKDWLLVTCRESADSRYAMQPIGPPSRWEAVEVLLSWLRTEKGERSPRIEKADTRLIGEPGRPGNLSVEPTREHFDYVYLRDDLVQLAGNRYRSKRNHINKVLRTYSFAYVPLDPAHVDDCLEVQEKWCLARRCEDDLNLLGEWEAIREVLAHFDALKVRGGAVVVDGKVEAFTIGELLNRETAVIHIEKANPEIEELYSVVNQQCAENCWEQVSYINREQDLGIPGLREAKLSYHPHRLVEKYRITLI